MGSERQKNTDYVILDLAYSENPAAKGQYKIRIRVFAYELGRGDRILYNAGKIKDKTFDNMDDLKKDLKSRP